MTQDLTLINWIRLTRTHNIGRATFFNLLDIFQDPKTALENVEQFSLKGGLKNPIKPCDINIAIKELEQTRKFGAEIITFASDNYPKLLREIADPPPILTVKGKTEFLNRDTIAIVGPRNASFNGCKFAKMIASGLGENQIVVASGLARGIDTAAHEAALDYGTIAVIAGGIDNIYPPENANLYHKIANQGLLISEIPFGTPPRGGNFPQRNRIVSGLSLGAVIIEATLKSGTLITARYALEQNREIFAVPGNPMDPRAHGTNRLIKQGAKMLETIDDILREIEPLRGQTMFEFKESESKESLDQTPIIPAEDDIDQAREQILEKLGYSQITNDEIISELGITARIVNIALVQLELADRIINKNGKILLK